jgi:hypothetical protein
VCFFDVWRIGDVGGFLVGSPDLGLASGVGTTYIEFLVE